MLYIKYSHIATIARIDIGQTRKNNNIVLASLYNQLRVALKTSYWVKTFNHPDYVMNMFCYKGIEDYLINWSAKQKANYTSLIEGQKHSNTLEDCFYLRNITKHQYLTSCEWDGKIFSLTEWSFN